MNLIEWLNDQHPEIVRLTLDEIATLLAKADEDDIPGQWPTDYMDEESE